MSRVTRQGFVLISPFTGNVIGVGFDHSGAYGDGEWFVNETRKNLFDKGYHTVPAKITVTFRRNKGAPRSSTAPDGASSKE